MKKPWDDEDAVIWSGAEIGVTEERVPEPVPVHHQERTPEIMHKRYLDRRITCTRRDLLWAYIEVFTIGILAGVLITYGIFRLG